MARADTISVGPLEVDFLVENDALSMFECRVPPGGRVPARHSHDAFEETIYGLSGSTFFTVGGERHTLARGEAVHVPRGVVHGFDVGDEGAAFLAIATPGVFGSAYFRELGGVIAASAGPPDHGRHAPAWADPRSAQLIRQATALRQRGSKGTTRAILVGRCRWKTWRPSAAFMTHG